MYTKSLKNRKAYNRLCVPPSFRKKIVTAYHDDSISGHMGKQRTLAKISKRYFWTKLVDDISNYVRACPIFQGRKSVQKAPSGLLHCIKGEQPFENEGIGILGPFPCSKNGNNNIIVALDYLTKWVEVKALPNAKSDDVAKLNCQRRNSNIQRQMFRSLPFRSGYEKAFNKP